MHYLKEHGERLHTGVVSDISGDALDFIKKNKIGLIIPVDDVNALAAAF